MAESNEPKSVRLTWADSSALPILSADELSIMFGREGEFIVTIGQASPPILSGSPQEQQAETERLGSFPVRPLARYGVTRARLEAFVAALQSNLKRHDEHERRRDKLDKLRKAIALAGSEPSPVSGVEYTRAVRERLARNIADRGSSA